MAVSIIGPKFYAWDRCGKPLAFGKLYTYQARTNTPKPTYQSEDQQVENTNPVILNGEGYANVYLDDSYKMVLKDKDENEIWSADPVTSATADEWTNCFSAVYASSTSFKIFGNQTAEYRKDRKVRIDNNVTEYSYSTIVSSNYANGETTVVVADPVIATGVGGVCTSIVSPESSFTGNDIYQFSPFSFLTVEDMKEGNSIGGQDIDLDALASIKAFVFTKFNNLTSMAGGAKYEILSATDYSGTPDGFRDHYIGGDTQIVAKLVVEQYADVTQFGAVKDGVTNDTDSFMSAHNAVTKNQHVFIPSGEYRVALIDWTRPIVGDGCTLKPIDGMNQILKLGFHAEYTTWDFKPISGVTFDGTDESGAPKGSVGVSMLDDVEPQLSGRYSFVDCLFVNCTVGVQKPQGNIGNQFVRCTWTSNSYGMTAFGSSGSTMHAGADSFLECHFETSDIAAYYLKDDTPGVGQVVFTDCIFEQNKGFAIFFRFSPGNPTTFVPFTLKNTWFEGNASEPTVSIDDLPNQVPRDLRCDGVDICSVYDTYIKSMEANSSSIVLYNCRIDSDSGNFSIVRDSESFIVSENTYSNNNSLSREVYHKSVSRVQTSSINGGFSGRAPYRSAKQPANSSLVESLPFNDATPVLFTGTGSRNTVPILGGFHGDYVHELTVPAGFTLLNGSFDPTDDKYYFGSVMLRKKSGDDIRVAFSGTGSLGSFYYHPNGDNWACATFMCKASGQGACNFRLINGNATDTVVEFSELQIVEFDTEAEMLDYNNNLAYME